jgi:hypothetical protein
MTLGSKGESIDTKNYKEAALNAKKINANEVNDFTRHLGKNFEVILQSCSTASKGNGSKNIAEIMSERHQVEVSASDVTIYGLTISSDGTVKFSTDKGDGEPVVYSN